MDDKMFNGAEEDLHEFYIKHNKVDKVMSYRRKLSLNLMTADFIYLHFNQGYKHILVMLGMDEHKYVRFAQETIKRIKKDKGNFPNFGMNIGGLYSSMIKGFFNYPKMSKSFPKSGLTVNESPDVIKDKIMTGEGKYDKPENNVIYQMMCGASKYDPIELKEKYEACLKGGYDWEYAKEEYAEMLINICSNWES